MKIVVKKSSDPKYRYENRYQTQSDLVKILILSCSHPFKYSRSSKLLYFCQKYRLRFRESNLADRIGKALGRKLKLKEFMKSEQLYNHLYHLITNLTWRLQFQRVLDQRLIVIGTQLNILELNFDFDWTLALLIVRWPEHHRNGSARHRNVILCRS